MESQLCTKARCNCILRFIIMNHQRCRLLARNDPTMTSRPCRLETSERSIEPSQKHSYQAQRMASQEGFATESKRCNEDTAPVCRDSERGTARPEVLQGLLKTTERVVQEIDSVEYGLTDIQEYYANTGALKRAAEGAQGMTMRSFINRMPDQIRDTAMSSPRNRSNHCCLCCPKGCGYAPADGKEVGCSIVETFSRDVKPKELKEVLRLEYRSKLLNPKWAEVSLIGFVCGARIRSSLCRPEPSYELIALVACHVRCRPWPIRGLAGHSRYPSA